MSISAQQHRIRIGIFSQPRVSTCKPTYSLKRKLQSHHGKSTGLKTTLLLLFCFAIIWYTNTASIKKSRPQSSHGNNRGNHRSFLPGSGYTIDHNFWARYKHGNRRGAGLKLCHWNKGGSFLHNKTNEIEHIIGDYKPHILGISEANFHSNHSLEDVQIQNYTLYLADTLKNPQLNISRVAVYVHKDVIVKVRDDLMTDSFSSIWLEVGLKRQKKFLVSNVYRDWKYVNQVSQDSGTIASQLSRWESFLQQWETAIATDSEIHVLGDVNLNFLDFNNQNVQPNSHSARLRPLVDALLDRVVPHGFSQLITDVTRVWPGQEPSLLDHHWTNRPEKVSGVHAFYQGGSDHKMIFSIRHTKKIVSKPRIIKKRCFKNFKPQEFIEAVQKISWF